MNKSRRTPILAMGGITLLLVVGCTPTPDKLVSDHFSRAIDLADDGDIDGAFSAFSTALEIDPNHAPSLVYRGLLHNSQGQYAQGFTDCDRALAVVPQDIEALFCRGAAAYSLNALEEAMADLNAILELDPKHKGARIMRGALYVIVGEHELALQDLDLALADIDLLEADDTELALALFNRATIHFYKSNFSQAITDLTHALELNPDYVEAMAVLGNAYDNDGDFEKALECYAKALEMDARGVYHPLILLDRGEAYARRNLKEEATADLNKAIELGLNPGGVELAEQILESLDQPAGGTPQTAEEYYLYAMDLRDRGRLAESITAFTTTIELDPDYLYVYNERGLAFYASGNLEKALEDFDRAILQVPNDAFAYNNRGLVYEDLGDLDAAIEDYSQACELDTSYVTARFNRALAYMKLESFAPAIEDLGKVIALVPEETSAYYFRGIAYALAGQHRYALSDLAFVIDNSDNDARIAASYYFRGRVYLDINEDELAYADLETALNMGLPASIEKEARELLAEGAR